MSNILATPAAREAAKEKGIDLMNIKGSGEFGSIRLKDLANATPSAMVEKGVKATPVAKNVAAYYGADIASVTPSGNKITKADVLNSLNAAPKAGEVAALQVADLEPKVVPYTGMRKSIGDNMSASLTNLAQLTQFAEIDTTKLMALFKEAKETYKSLSEYKLTLTDLLIKIVSIALMDNEKVNSTLEGDKIYMYPYVNMGLAVALDNGLVVPVIKNTDRLSIKEICELRSDCVPKARDNKLKGDSFKGGTFTITNTGNSIVGFSTPVINPPQVAILGVGRTEEKPVVIDGEIQIRTMTYFSLTIDHRALDGMDGVKFMNRLNELIQNPMCVLL